MAGDGTHPPRGFGFESDGSARDGELAETIRLSDGDIDGAGVRDQSPDTRDLAAAGSPPPGGADAEPGPDAAADGKPAGRPPSGHRHGPRSRHRSSRARRARKGTPPGGAPRKRKKAHWWELPLLIAVAIAVAVLIKTFLVQPFYIPSESMEHTLHGCPGCSGDRIIVNKPIYDLRDPHPGDIVVFRAPTNQWFNEPFPAAPSNPILKGLHWFGQLIGFVPPDEHDLVKRVIAIGGQTIRCCDANGNIQISTSGPSGPWRSLTEPYVSSHLPPAQAAFGPVTVPDGRLWVMGDNRAHSEDSRWHYLHDYRGDAVQSTVPIGKVIGKAVLIAWPPSRWRTLGTPATFTAPAADAAVGAIPLLGSAGVLAPVVVLRRRRRYER